MSELPSGWVITSFPEIADVLDSRRVPLNAAERAERPGHFPYYGANGLVDHVGDYLFEGPHVLLAEDGGHFDQPERGVAYEVDGRFWVNNHAHILKPKGEVECGFLKHWLNATNWLPFVGGTTRAKLTQASLSKPAVPLPPLAEQKRIVAKVDGLTARAARARAELDRIPAMIERYKERLLVSVFSLDWQHDLGSAPVMAEVGDVASLSSGFGFPKDRQGKQSGDYPFAKVSDISRAVANSQGELVQAANYVDEGDLRTLRATPVPAGSTVFAKIGEALRLNRRAIAGVPLILDNNCMALSPDTRRVLPRYLFWFMRTIDLSPFAVATAVPSVRRGDVASLRLPVPTLTSQQAIVSKIEAAFSWLEVLSAEHAGAEQLLPKLDQATLAKAFRGELVPQDPSDEPASVLLDRIRAERAAAPTRKRKARA